MTARCVFYAEGGSTGPRATVVLTPGWLGYLFGARSVSVDLQREARIWRTIATDRELYNLRHGSLIRDALDFREVGSPARWALGAGAAAVAP